MNSLINPEDFVIKMTALNYEEVKGDPVFCSDFIKVLGKIMKLD
jgi:hypothetical protein